MKEILILCTGNSCRSQMAEGYLRLFSGAKASVKSAGIETHGVNALAVEVMMEDGVDISKQTFNHVSEYDNIKFDYVITVCDHAKEKCPFIPGAFKRFHQNFPDPAKAKGTRNEILKEFRTVRDLIKKYCQDFVKQEL